MEKYIKRDKLFISTQAISTNITDLVNFCIEEGVGIELSSGTDFSIDELFNIISNSSIQTRFHNYFPITLDPFVIDIASKDFKNRQRSLDFIKRNLLVSQRLGLNYYSFHAGFITNPTPRELGNSFKSKIINERIKNESLELFYKSVYELIEFSDNIGLTLLIENNVVGLNNYIDGFSVAHLSNHDEIMDFFTEFNNKNVKLLLDTAHYLISESSRIDYNFNPLRVKELAPFTIVIHHSESLGMSDSNLALTNGYWFADMVKYFKGCDHVLEVRNCTNLELKKSIYELEKALCQ